MTVAELVALHLSKNPAKQCYMSSFDDNKVQLYYFPDPHIVYAVDKQGVSMAYLQVGT